MKITQLINQIQLSTFLKEEKAVYPEIADKCKEVLADAGYDAKKNYEIR